MEIGTGHYTNMHIQPNLASGGRTGNVKCYNHGAVIDGSFKIQNNHSFAPTIIKCGHMCEKFDDCEGYWVYMVRIKVNVV